MNERLDEARRTFQGLVEAQDPQAVQVLLHDDFALVLVVPSLAVMPRARWLEVLADYAIHEYEVEEEIVDADGGLATVLQRVRMRATVMGQDRSGTFVISDVWRGVGDDWRLWRRHSTPFTAGALD